MCLCGLKLKKTISISHYFTYCTLLLLLYAPPFWNTSNFTKLIVLRSEACSDWPAIQCIVIGRIPQAWDGNVTPLTPCDGVSRRDETKTIKPITNEAFVASSGDIITDYNDLYCLFTRRVASRRINITMSAFVIREMLNNKHYSTQLKTHVWIVSSRNVLTGCELDASDCSCKVGIAPLYRNSLCASLQARLLSCQVQEIVLRELRRTLEYLRCTALEQCCKYNLTTDF